MNYEALYDTLVCDTYDEDVFGILEAAHLLALEQVVRHLPASGAQSACDVAAGTGRFLQVLGQRFPQATLYGLDISTRMLEGALQRLPHMRAFQADARSASQQVGEGSMELSIAHFVMSYLDPSELLAELYRITAPGGLCSVANSTYQTFAAMQQLALQCMSESEIRAHSNMPLDASVMAQLVTAAGFEVLETASLRKPVRFASFEDLHQWGVRSGFLTTFFEALAAPQLQALSQISAGLPLADHFQGAFIVGRKL